MSGDDPTAIDSTCPRCGVTSTMDRRFVVWCEACGWNADPEPVAAPTGRRARRAHRYGERLFADLLANGPDGASVGRTPVLAAVALLVWAIWLGLAVIGVWLLVRWWPNLAGVLLAAPVFLIVYLLRPRLGRVADGAVRVTRSDGPELHALVDTVAGAMGAPPVDVIVLDPRFNAGIRRVGLRRRVVLHLGAPMWLTLPPDQRVALLAHELAHVRNGDPRRGFVVWSAASMLLTWHEFLSPPPSYVAGGIEQTIARAILVPPAWLVARLIEWFVGLGLRSGLQAEYLSDHAAAQVAGSDAVVGLLDSILLGQTAEFAVVRASLDGADADRGWALLQARIRDLPDHERRRLQLVAGRRQHVEDDSHPPTAHRRRLVAGSPAPARVELAADRSRVIDEQLRRELATVWGQASRAALAARYH